MHPIFRTITSPVLWYAGISRPLRRWAYALGIRISRDWYGRERIGRIYHTQRSFMMGNFQNEITRRSFWFDSYFEPHAMCCLNALDDLMELFIDCSSQVGVFALYVSAGGREKEVYALEENHEQYKILSDNVRLNHFSVALDCVSLNRRPGLDDESSGSRQTTLDEYFIGDGRLSSSLQPGGVFLRLGSDKDPVSVLKGGRKFLEQYRPTIFFTAKGSGDSYFDTLRSMGYRFLLMLPGGLQEIEQPHSETLDGLSYGHVIATVDQAVIDRLVGPASKVDFSAIKPSRSSLAGMAGDS